MAEEESTARSSKTIIILIALVLILIAVLGGAVGWYFLAGKDDAVAIESQEQQEAVKPKAIYVNLRILGGRPSFISNFYKGSGRQHFMQIYADARTRNPEVVDALKKHMPLVVHSLSTLFSNQDFTAMQTDEGRQGLRREATAKVQEVLQNEIGEPGIDAVFFTNFVMQ